MAAAPAPNANGLPELLEPTRVTLLQRGHYREQHLRRESIVQGVQSPDGKRSPKRLSTAAFTRSTRNVLAAGDDHLDDLLKQVADSINSPDQLPRSDKEALVLQAILGLWTRHQEARGFRRWKESTLHRVDIPALVAAGVDVHEEARQLLLAAETKRRIVAKERRTDTDDDKWMAANFSYAELDLLVAWARHTQPKTCRGVDDNTLREALRYLRFSQYQDGEAIFFQGDKGDVFYLVLDGSVGIYGAKRPPQTEKHKRKQSMHGDSATKHRPGAPIREKPDMNLMGPRMFTYRAGESFGETALFTNAAVRTATAIAFGATTSGHRTGTVCELGEISRRAYSRTLKKFHQHFFTQAQRVNFAQRVFLFQDWPRPRVMEVAEVLELRRISFGSALFTQGVSPLSHCFFVLSGTVNIITQLEIKSCTDAETSATQNTAVFKKTRHRAPLTIELHTARVGEIVALEALLEDDESTARATYSAVGGSADVEVYALKRTDGRAFLATSTTNILRQLESLCKSERAHRDERIEIARRALDKREAVNKKHRLHQENEAFELGLTDEQQHQRQKQHELEELGDVSCCDSSRGPLFLEQPFLPHLDPIKLQAGVDESKPEPRSLSRKFEVCTSLSQTAMPPKMLSTLAKSFIVRDWDTLADNYAQRLTLQLPVRSPLINQVPPSLTCRPDTLSSAQTRTARRRRAPASVPASFREEEQTRDSHMRQLSTNYDAKMHWDPEKKNFVLQALPANEVNRQPPQRMTNARISNEPCRRTEVVETTTNQSLQYTKLHYQLQTAQVSARKLSIEHSRKVDERSSGTGPPNTFVHFF